MRDAGQVKRAPQQTHEPHSWASHALRPGLGYKQAVQDEVPLRRIKVEAGSRAPDPTQECTLRVAPCTVAGYNT